MKPILSVKVQRGVELKEWVSAKDQATLDGLQDFKRRQEERRKLAQGEAVYCPSMATRPDVVDAQRKLNTLLNNAVNVKPIRRLP